MIERLLLNFAPPMIWGMSVTALSRLAGDYYWWWCPFTPKALADLSFWSAIGAGVLFAAAMLLVDGVVAVIRRCKP